MLKESASQTAGPYVHIGLMPNFAGLPNVFPADLGQDMRIAEPAGEPIEIVLRVLDGTAAPLTDAVVELWQADADGRYAVPGAFLGFGRQATDAETGECRFRTIKPDACRSATAARWHRMSPFSWWRAASISGFTRGSTLPTKRRPMPRTPSLPWSMRRVGRRSSRSAKAASTVMTSTCRARNETVFFDV